MPSFRSIVFAFAATVGLSLVWAITHTDYVDLATLDPTEWHCELTDSAYPFWQESLRCTKE